MILASTRAAFLLTVTLGFALIPFTPAWPGGDAGDADDHSHDDGPRFFGFIKDTSGRIVPDAKVTAEIKGLGSVVTRSDKVRNLQAARLWQTYFTQQHNHLMQQRWL